MTKTVRVRGYYRKDGTYVGPHDRVINSPNSVTRSSSYTSYSGGSGGGKAAAGGGGLLLALLFLIGITSGGGDSAGTSSPSPTSTVIQHAGVTP
ncbi:hypothetical protein ACIHEI_27705 [Kitasatospora sp. NPDC051984]|uniref:hypothetical protein n=1 Tax=Kitasatospora sp. NPDC051984 TaxID=3364059 RepID=UPI0037C72D5D